MKDWKALQGRYLNDELPTRLGGLAANLARIKSLTKSGVNGNAVEYLIRESKFFIEWTAMDAGMDYAAELVELQVQLARWQFHWSKIWADEAKRINVAEQARVWTERVLEMSGLLSEPVASPNQG
ncbi:MAG: hypothetical protein RIG63_18050 [Coleofasciculus chthonoplastes F3-SA18-01]|jgi:hypothetical protein|uniref:hypothetical protein n=1 Tax=Coleofasciculus chthonoplastes TaxID=64178 RepID=UPI0032FDA2E1